MRRFLLAIMAPILLVNSLTLEASELVIKYHDQSWSPSLRHYQIDLLKLILERTTEKYGPYRLEPFSQPMTANRSKITLQLGKDLNIMFVTELSKIKQEKSRIIEVELPIFNGLLGLRNMVIRQEDQQEFSAIQNRAEFLHFSAGQGANWADVGILRANQVPVIEAQTMGNLFPMLQKRRFDYVSLSVMELEPTLLNKPAQMDNIQLFPNLLLFYPVTTYLNVPITQPEIAERLSAGFAAVSKNGELSALFERHFSAIINKLKSENRQLVIMHNPYISAARNQQMTADLVNGYGRSLSPLN